MKAKTFYITENGKEFPHNFKAGEYKEYEDICLTIWGCLPYDLTWARGTGIYKKEEQKRKEKS